VELPDGSRLHVLAAWTDLAGASQDHQRCRGLQAIDRFRPPVPPLAIGAVGNVGARPLSLDMAAHAIGIVALVGDDDSTFIEAVEQRLGMRHVVVVARRDQDSDGTTFRVDPRVDLGGEAASASPHTTISTLFLTPEAC